MSNGTPITVAGGGSIAVETGTMLAASRTLAAAEADLRSLRAAVADLESTPEWGALDPGVRSRALATLAAADRAFTAAIDAADTVRAGLAIAATRYGRAETVATRAADSAAAGIAAVAGAALRIAVLAGPGAVVGVAMVAAGTIAAVDGPIVIARIARREDPITDPVLIAELRLAIGSIDDATRGFLGLERPADVALDHPDDPFAAAAVAGGIAALAQAVLPMSTRLRVAAVEPEPVPFHAPRSLTELTARMPVGSPGEPQFRIERYVGADGIVRWIVSIAGTVTFAPSSGSEPFDMRSNLQGVAGVESGSEDAVLQAMAKSGIRPDDPVLLIGHSQGALAAARIAQRGDYDVAAVVTLGGPSGQLILPADVPQLSVEHDNDLVPALGGIAATGAAGRRRVLVRRTVPQSELLDEPVAAHDDAAYTVTVGMAERSGAPQIREFERSASPFLTGGDGTAVDWRADRASGTRAPIVPLPIGRREQ